MMTYAIKTTFAMSAARPPAYVALPRSSQHSSLAHDKEGLTLKDPVDGKEVGADWQCDHGKSEAHQLPDDRPVVM